MKIHTTKQASKEKLTEISDGADRGRGERNVMMIMAIMMMDGWHWRRR